MERYDQLYRLYEEFDTETLRAYQDFVDLFPPVDSRVALEHWQEANDERATRKDDIRGAFPATGETFAAVAARATREQAFAALDLRSKYGRGVNVLVLDVDETLRSAGKTDNEIPRETLHLLTEFHEAGMPVVICTGQTLENVKGFLVQGLGNELVHSGEVSIVYEAGTGVFTPGHGADTKQLLYEDLDSDIRAVFDGVRSRVFPDAPEELRRGCHLQGNEFNVTLKPNFETGSTRAHELIDRALVYQLDLLGEAVAAELDADPGAVSAWVRAHYATEDPEIRAVLEGHGQGQGHAEGEGHREGQGHAEGQGHPEGQGHAEMEGGVPEVDPDDVPGDVADLIERIEVAYYGADAAEVRSLELNKVAGVQAAFDVLEIDDPFALVMGDSKSDLRVMRWVDDHDAGIAAGPEHASREVLDHVIRTDKLVFGKGRATDPLRTIYALNRLARLD